MYIYAVKTEKVTGRTAKLSTGSFVYTHFEDFPQKYAGHRAYLGTFSRKYVFRKFFSSYIIRGRLPSPR